MPSSTSRSTKKTAAQKTTKKQAAKPAVKASAKPAPKKTVKAAAASKPAAMPRTTRKTAVAAATPSPAFVVTHDVIAQRAHDLYVQSGYQGHRQEEFWLEAERQLRDGAQF